MRGSERRSEREEVREKKLERGSEEENEERKDEKEGKVARGGGSKYEYTNEWKVNDHTIYSEQYTIHTVHK